QGEGFAAQDIAAEQTRKQLQERIDAPKKQEAAKAAVLRCVYGRENAVNLDGHYTDLKQELGAIPDEELYQAIAELIAKGVVSEWSSKPHIIGRPLYPGDTLLNRFAKVWIGYYQEFKEKAFEQLTRDFNMIVLMGNRVFTRPFPTKDERDNKYAIIQFIDVLEAMALQKKSGKVMTNKDDIDEAIELGTTKPLPEYLHPDEENLLRRRLLTLMHIGWPVIQKAMDRELFAHAKLDWDEVFAQKNDNFEPASNSCKQSLGVIVLPAILQPFWDNLPKYMTNADNFTALTWWLTGIFVGGLILSVVYGYIKLRKKGPIQRMMTSPLSLPFVFVSLLLYYVVIFEKTKMITISSSYDWFLHGHAEVFIFIPFLASVAALIAHGAGAFTKVIPRHMLSSGDGFNYYGWHVWARKYYRNYIMRIIVSFSYLYLSFKIFLPIQPDLFDIAALLLGALLTWLAFKVHSPPVFSTKALLAFPNEFDQIYDYHPNIQREAMRQEYTERNFGLVLNSLWSPDPNVAQEIQQQNKIDLLKREFERAHLNLDLKQHKEQYRSINILTTLVIIIAIVEAHGVFHDLAIVAGAAKAVGFLKVVGVFAAKFAVVMAKFFAVFIPKIFAVIFPRFQHLVRQNLAGTAEFGSLRKELSKLYYPVSDSQRVLDNIFRPTVVFNPWMNPRFNDEESRQDHINGLFAKEAVCQYACNIGVTYHKFIDLVVKRWRSMCAAVFLLFGVSSFISPYTENFKKIIEVYQQYGIPVPTIEQMHTQGVFWLALWVSALLVDLVFFSKGYIASWKEYFQQPQMRLLSRVVERLVRAESMRKRADLMSDQGVAQGLGQMSQGLDHWLEIDHQKWENKDVRPQDYEIALKAADQGLYCHAGIFGCLIAARNLVMGWDLEQAVSHIQEYFDQLRDYYVGRFMALAINGEEELELRTISVVTVALRQGDISLMDKQISQLTERTSQGGQGMVMPGAEELKRMEELFMWDEQQAEILAQAGGISKESAHNIYNIALAYFTQPDKINDVVSIFQRASQEQIAECDVSVLGIIELEVVSGVKVSLSYEEAHGVRIELPQEGDVQELFEGLFNNLNDSNIKILMPLRAQARKIKSATYDGIAMPIEFYEVNFSSRAPPEEISDVFGFYVVEDGILKIYLSSGTIVLFRDNFDQNELPIVDAAVARHEYAHSIGKSHQEAVGEQRNSDRYERIGRLLEALQVYFCSDAIRRWVDCNGIEGIETMWE
ncbi:MAG: hypothetical protein NTY47_05850, partial [Candidatus Omnitrophica bacterium]|nr:hypothetical protein [Candidatus Omnitrophota bacterium]